MHLQRFPSISLPPVAAVGSVPTQTQESLLLYSNLVSSERCAHLEGIGPPAQWVSLSERAGFHGYSDAHGGLATAFVLPDRNVVFFTALYRSLSYV